MEKQNSAVEKDVVLVFFDILGSAKRITDGQYKQVYNFYSEMIELCSMKDIALSCCLPGSAQILKEGGYPKGTETILSFPMSHAFFSDTFIIWVEYIDFFGMRLSGFYEICNEIFAEAIKRRIPLRGAVSRGKAIMDEDKKIYLGKPIVEAARLESAQEWLGLSLGFSCGEKIYPTEAHNLILYTKHYKKNLLEQENAELIFADGEDREAVFGYGEIASPAVLNWPRYWREHEKGNLIEIISDMNADPKYSAYYQNTMDFVKFSNENLDIMKPLEDIAPPMVPKIVRYL